MFCSDPTITLAIVESRQVELLKQVEIQRHLQEVRGRGRSARHWRDTGTAMHASLRALAARLMTWLLVGQAWRARARGRPGGM